MAMATIDKTSIRKEVDRLKQEFDKLCSAGSVSPEIRAAMNSILVVVDLIPAIFLEKTTHKNNKTSSLPSSHTEKDETAGNKYGVENGKGKKVSGEIINTRTKETVTVTRALTCDICGVSLDKVSCRGMNGGQRTISFSRRWSNISMRK